MIKKLNNSSNYLNEKINKIIKLKNHLFIINNYLNLKNNN